MFETWLTRWGLSPDGAPVVTPAASLLPVLKYGEPTMLKLSCGTDGRLGGSLLEWWAARERRGYSPGAATPC